MRSTRPLSRLLSLPAAVLVALMISSGVAVLSAPQASADCFMTPADQQYLYLLAKYDIGPAPGSTGCDIVLSGRQIADTVRASSNPLATMVSIAQDIYYASSLTEQQSGRVVAAAVLAYAPEMIPVIRGTPSRSDVDV